MDSIVEGEEDEDDGDFEDYYVMGEKVTAEDVLR